MTLDLDQLEALAKAATPGPWTACDYGSYDGKAEGWYVDTTADKADIAPDAGGIQPNHWDTGRGRRDMQFIAAANPEAVLALIAEVRALRKDKARLDSGCIMRTDWDDYGDTVKIDSRGNNLRQMIDEAMEVAKQEAASREST